MTREPETLTELVAARVGVPGGMTYRTFEERAIDPASGRRVGKSVLWKIANGQQVIVTPEVVSAVIAALGLPEARVRAAAAYQYTGLVLGESVGGYVLHDPAVDADTPATEKAVRQQRERAEREGG